MKNMQIAGTGNSRFMKSAIPETATWEEFRDMLRAGTFAFDFNGVNEAGIAEKGTPYDVDNVLSDSTAELLGGGPNMVPNQAFLALKNLIDNLTPGKIGASAIASGSYVGTGTNAQTKTITVGFKPRFAMIAENGFGFAASKASSTADGNLHDVIIWCEGISTVDTTAGFGGDEIAFTQTDTGLKLKAADSTEFNAASTIYYYVLFG